MLAAITEPMKANPWSISYQRKLDTKIYTRKKKIQNNHNIFMVEFISVVILCWRR